MCEIVYNILITNFTVHRCIIRSNAPSNLQMQPLGCIFVYALNCITFGTAIDPACGSGNFITETYISLRRLENEALIEETNRQLMIVSSGNWTPIEVSIGQFYCIEINDFALFQRIALHMVNRLQFFGSKVTGRQV